MMSFMKYKKWNNKKLRETMSYSFRIALGSSVAMFIASLLNLEFAVSAGSITLLTLVTTKWETLKLSIFRIITFAFTVGLSWIVFENVKTTWLDYGLLIFGMSVFCCVIGWKSTISVNAVIATHFLTTKDYSIDFIKNEFMLIMIGISVAIVINLFQHNRNHKKELVENIKYTEIQMKKALHEMAAYLSNEDIGKHVWDDVIELEKKIQYFVDEAYRYENNTFQTHTSYYIYYFEMRLQQCTELHNLHYEVKKIRSIPSQAQIITNYIMYMTDYITEENIPDEQIAQLENIIEQMKSEPLPVTQEEFESRAILYHILFILEDFLIYKRRFIEILEEKHIEKYWKSMVK